MGSGAASNKLLTINGGTGSGFGAGTVLQRNSVQTAIFSTDSLIGGNADGASVWSSEATRFYTGGSNERMRIDSSGNVGIGTSSPSANLEVKGASGQNIYVSYTSGSQLRLKSDSGDSGVGTTGATPLLFLISNGEKARIDSSGNLLVGVTSTATGGASEIRTATTGVNSFTTSSSGASPYGYYVKFTSANPNNTSNYFWNADSSTEQKAVIWSNGTFGSRTSTYGGISDVKLKQDIVDASSQWTDIKAIRVRKYRFKSDPDGHLQIGVIAQELEQTSAGLIDESPDFGTDEDGNRIQLDTTTKSVKYSILYMKAVKALQESMERIESLEAKADTQAETINALTARIVALESK